MATVRTGIGASKRDLLKKIVRLTKFVHAKKREFTAKDKRVFTKTLFNMGAAYKFLDKIPCVQTEMSLPFGYDQSAGRRSRKTRRAR